MDLVQYRPLAVVPRLLRNVVNSQGELLLMELFKRCSDAPDQDQEASCSAHNYQLVSFFFLLKTILTWS